MHPRSTLTHEQRAALVGLFEQGFGYKSAARQVGVGKKPARNLYDRWQIRGSVVLVRKPNTSVYPFEVKRDAVLRFLAGESRGSIAKDLGLSRPDLVRKWARIYEQQGEDGLRPKPKGRPAKSGSKPSKPLSETEQLRRQVEYLQAENAYLKALRDLMRKEQ